MGFVSHDIDDPVRDHEHVAGQIRRGGLFFYLQKNPCLGADEPSSASTHVLVVDSAEVHNAGKFVCVKFSAGQRVSRRRRGSEKPPGLVIHVALRKTFAVKVVGVSFLGYVNSCQPRERKVFAIPRVSLREQQNDGLHTFSRDVHVDDFPRGALGPTQSFQQGRVVVTQRPSDVVLVPNFPYEILALYDLVFQMEVRKFVFPHILAVQGFEDFLGLREGYSILEVKHTVRRVRTVVFEDLSEGNLHFVAHFGDGQIQNPVSLCGLVTETELLSVVPVFLGSPKILVDLHHAFASVLVDFHALDFDAEPVDEESSEVVQKPRLRVAVGEFERQRKGVPCTNSMLFIFLSLRDQRIKI